MENERQSSPGTPVAEQTFAEHRNTVLLIDDNAIQSGARQAILRRARYSVVTAHDPRRILEQLQSKQLEPPPNAVITDHVMPAMTGSDFVRELRKTHPDLPVMVLSGLHEAEAEYAAMKVLFLRKPLLPELLLSHLREMLKRERPDASADVEAPGVASR